MVVFARIIKPRKLLQSNKYSYSIEQYAVAIINRDDGQNSRTRSLCI